MTHHAPNQPIPDDIIDAIDDGTVQSVFGDGDHLAKPHSQLYARAYSCIEFLKQLSIDAQTDAPTSEHLIWVQSHLVAVMNLSNSIGEVLSEYRIRKALDDLHGADDPIEYCGFAANSRTALLCELGITLVTDSWNAVLNDYNSRSSSPKRLLHPNLLRSWENSKPPVSLRDRNDSRPVFLIQHLGTVLQVVKRILGTESEGQLKSLERFKLQVLGEIEATAQPFYSSELIGNAIPDPGTPMTTGEIAQYLFGEENASLRQTVLRWMKSGRLPANRHIPIRDNYCVSLSALDRLKQKSRSVSDA